MSKFSQFYVLQYIEGLLDFFFSNSRTKYNFIDFTFFLELINNSSRLPNLFEGGESVFLVKHYLAQVLMCKDSEFNNDNEFPLFSKEVRIILTMYANFNL